MTRDVLERLQLVASIVSSIAIPIVLGVVGWWVQQSISDAALKKDYTDMALRVIEHADTKKQDDLRLWAVDILDRNAPLPFSASVREQLLGGAFVFTHQLEMNVPEEFMVPPQPWVEAPKNGFASNDLANANYAENWKRAAINAATLDALQRTVRVFQESRRKFEVELQKTGKRPTEEK